ncbi:hypothetical protein [Azospirillum halopraeferens]|uniref:hypothetical protein n=1 Tax=Azospirillum halopraeferens TaxID=34010 RepID=UPI00040C70BF|nr:hypothetical protein [Azospirillum halopraeferens]
MWTVDDVTVDLDEAEWPVVIITVTTPAGTLRIAGNVTVEKDVLVIDQAHVEGLSPGALGRSGLNVVGRKVMEIANVREVVIQGATRTTGKHRGRVPSCIRFPR